MEFEIRYSPNVKRLIEIYTKLITDRTELIIRHTKNKEDVLDICDNDTLLQKLRIDLCAIHETAIPTYVIKKEKE